MEPRRFRFGLFEFDISAMQLRQDGATVHLQSQPKQVLACLITNADRAVSREELRKLVWGDETFVDFERGLNFCIAQIRKALDDDAAKPLYIRTFAKQGYQFIAPVESVPAQAPGADKQLAPAWLQQRLVLIGFAVPLLALLTFATVHWLRSSPVRRQQPVVAVVRFDNETGNPEITRFSDGLTDNVVERLTCQSSGRYAVIGNAQILRTDRIVQTCLHGVGDHVGAHLRSVLLGNHLQRDLARTEAGDIDRLRQSRQPLLDLALDLLDRHGDMQPSLELTQRLQCHLHTR